MNGLKIIDIILAKILKYFVVALFASLAVLLLLRVLIRFFPIYKIYPNLSSMSWSEEVVGILMSWMIFTTSSLIMRNNDHFKVTILDDKLKGTAFRNYFNAAIALIGIMFFIALTKYSWSLLIVGNQTTPILKWSSRIPYSSIFVNSILMLIYLIKEFIVNLVKIRYRDLS
ncbi:MAG: TRAP transporter small permease [Fusobacteriaceae bacterium]|jgi:TRAP-type C4-dicarboxylate transport system permease small subunit|nr:TRAP transporter small permease [Fusobacteriaceae bacterium]